MKANASMTVYDQICVVVSEYLGPATKRFIARLVKANFDKKPKELTVDDIPKLHEWSKMAIAHMTQDDQTVEDFSRDLMAIIDQRSKNRSV